jgi:hypothetical protein
MTLTDFTVHERMSWIKDRQTKHGEDKANSLQGIFNVYMLPEDAFTRLRAGINMQLPKPVTRAEINKQLPKPGQ